MSALRKGHGLLSGRGLIGNLIRASRESTPVTYGPRSLAAPAPGRGATGDRGHGTARRQSGPRHRHARHPGRRRDLAGHRNQDPDQRLTEAAVFCAFFTTPDGRLTAAAIDARAAITRADLNALLYADGIYDSLYRTAGRDITSLARTTAADTAVSQVPAMRAERIEAPAPA